MKQIHLFNLKEKLQKIEREIIESIKILDNLQDDNRPRCIKCSWRNLSVRKDKTYFCKSCGFDSRRKEKA